MADRDVIDEEREKFELAYEEEAERRTLALEDLRFARLGEQWPDQIKRQRELENRPCLTINRMPAFIRQVVNDARQNRPQIKVKPVDDYSDIETAQVIEGTIRNIEYVSKADVAYDTAIEHAASMGWGYVRLSIDYEYDDSFDKGIRIKRVSNPFSVYGDPYSTEADSSDWNQAHIVDYMPREAFRRKYKGAEEVDWDATGYTGLKTPWMNGEEELLVCEAWTREQVDRPILQLSSGQIVGAKEFEQSAQVMQMLGIYPINQRMSKSYKITQRIMTGAEILEENEWAGTYIPVIPVYGEEINVEGKRHYRSLIHFAKDSQRMFNYWRSTATEMVALAPRVPYIGNEMAFTLEPEKWNTANSTSWPYIAIPDGAQPPQRQPMDPGNAVGAMSEALAAQDDMKAIIGMYDASLGQRSNETSGRAIMARQQEGDVSTFHFIDNLSRAIRHVGCCLIDLIPKVYTGERIIRILGEDGKEETKRIGNVQTQDPMQADPSGQMQPEQTPDETGGDLREDVARIYDLSVGKYDVAVTSGPSNTTRREQASIQMTEFYRAFPQAAQFTGDLYAKMQDWPYAEEFGERMKGMLPPELKGENPEVQQMQQQMQDMQAQFEQQMQQMQDQLAQAQQAAEDAKQKTAIDRQKLRIEGYKAETERLRETLPYTPPERLAMMGLQMSGQAMQTPDIAMGEPSEMMPEQAEYAPQQPPMGQPGPQMPPQPIQ